MATPQSTIASDPALSDPTFTGYNSTAAATYNALRPAYPNKLIETILSHHSSTGGEFNQLLDVGCGPGTATRSLSPFFHLATGCDPGVEMINEARNQPGRTATADRPVTYHVASASALASVPGVDAGTVDCITAAMAAHWFDMAEFWPQAARLLKPGGTVALWTAASYYAHPHTTPNYARVQQVLFELERDVLAPHEAPGNRISRDMYDNLLLPWDVDPPVAGFEKAAFQRMEWNREGAVAPGHSFFDDGGSILKLDELAKGLGTASMVTRWREANPDQARKFNQNTGKWEENAADCVSIMMGKLREALQDEEHGGEKGRDWLEAGRATVLLLFKKT